MSNVSRETITSGKQSKNINTKNFQIFKLNLNSAKKEMCKKKEFI